MLWAIILTCVTMLVFSWFNFMNNNYWDAMTIPAKIILFTIPIVCGTITLIVWFSIIL